MQIDHHPRRDSGGQRGAQSERVGFRGERAAEIRWFMIGVMQETVRRSAEIDFAGLARDIRQWGAELGFQKVGIADCEMAEAETRLMEWLAGGRHGDMDYMARHGTTRARPAELVPGTLRIIAVRMNYATRARASREVLDDASSAFVSRYALGRDYHKVLRRRLQRLADRISAAVGAFNYRAFVDSAPVMEVELARKAGIGWRGKHTLSLSRDAGSYYFLGELYTDLPLPVDEASRDHCGSCRRCIDACPTGAIVAPYQLDARRCISYLTIEHPGSIPEEFRRPIGNRVYGCDDCQLACPWNKYANLSGETDFAVRNRLDDTTLVELFAWSEETFHERLLGSAIHRIGYERWLRNLAVALGNAPTSPQIVTALRARSGHPSALVREHVGWALARHAG
jgi:epoxyqueuosine reductase